MSATSAALAGREAAEALMQDTCSIGHPAGETYHEDIDGYSQALTAVYDGPCKVKPIPASDRIADAAGEVVSRFPFIVSVPMSAPAVQVNDVVTITACTLDATLVGVQMRVREIALGSFLTARRFRCEVQT